MKKKEKTKRSTKSKPRISSWEYFDDCGICQAMKGAEKHNRALSLEELKYAFKKQNRKNSWPKGFISKKSK